MLLDLSTRPPEWLPPINTSQKARKVLNLSSTAQILAGIKSYDGLDKTEYTPTRTRLWTQTVERRERRQRIETEFQRQLSQWSPNKDGNIKGDAQSTLFLARLPYSITPDQIREEFQKYGSIESIRIVEPRRGYAFVVYGAPNGPECAAAAVQQTFGGMLFHGRRIITDLERGRLQMNWKPRRLGGGLGGRLSIARQRAEIARSNLIMKKGVRPPQEEGRKRPNNWQNQSTQNPSKYRKGSYERNGMHPSRQQYRQPQSQQQRQPQHHHHHHHHQHPYQHQHQHQHHQYPFSRDYRAPLNRSQPYDPDSQREKPKSEPRPGVRVLRQY